MSEDIWKEEKYRKDRGIVIVEILRFFPQYFPPYSIIKNHAWNYYTSKIF